MTGERYPNLSVMSIRVLVSAEPGEAITPALVTAATDNPGLYDFVLHELSKAHMIEGDRNELTGLADSYARMWRKWIKEEGP